MQQSWKGRLARGIGLLVGIGLATVLSRPAFSQDEGAFPPPKPIVIINVAGIERALNEIGGMFEAAGRPDMTDVLVGFLEEVAGDLNGLSRDQPVGVMFFLDDSSLPPRPAPVAYFPIENVQDLLKTAELGRLTATKTGENRYELTGRRGRAIHLAIQNGYGYATSSSEWLLDERLPDPRELTAGLTSRFDVSISLQIRNVAPLVRDVFIAFLRSSAEAQLQQRDSEGEAAYKLRRAHGMNLLALFEQVLRDGEQMILGLDASADGRRAAVELLVDAAPASEFARFMKNVAGRGTHFEPLLSEQHPLSLSVSWGTDRREQEALSGVVDALRTALLNRLPEERHAAVEGMTGSLQATVDLGHLDAVVQFVPLGGRFVLVGGLKIAGANSFASTSREVLEAVRELERIDAVELNAHEVRGIALHQLTGSRVRKEDRRIYGGKPSLYLGTGEGVAWFGLGGEGVVAQMDAAIERMQSAPPESRTGTTPPFQAVFRMGPWMNLPPRDDEKPLERELTNEAMERGDDAVRLEVRPTDTGGRIRFQFDEGFVRLLGLLIARQYDESQL